MFLLDLIAKCIIKIYQKTLSLDHGPLKFLFPNGYCRYYPSCSQYMFDAITIHGFFKGSWMGIKRVFRCTPFHEGGHDPVKKK